MDFKVATLLALMVASVVCMPNPPSEQEHPAAYSHQSHHEAPKCPCAKIYFPLCGSDGNSYNNMCEFTCQARHVHKLYGTEMFVIGQTRCEELK